MLWWTWGCRYHFEVGGFISFEYILRSGITGSYGTSILTFWGTFVLFWYIVAVPIYIPMNNVQSESESRSVMPNSFLQARILEWVAVPFSRRSSRLRDWTQVSHIAGGFFTSWATQGMPTNTRVGNLSLLQWIFLTQESNQGLLHCSRDTREIRTRLIF